jgi:hypothetical protein
LDGYKFGVPLYIEVGVFDFDAKAAGSTERKLQLNDAQTNLNIVCDASSRALLRKGQFPHRVMGTALFEVGEILGSRGNVVSKSLQTGGAIYASIERCREDGEQGKFSFQLRAFDLKNTHTRLTGMTSCPFFELLRKVDRHDGAKWYVWSQQHSQSFFRNARLFIIGIYYYAVESFFVLFCLALLCFEKVNISQLSSLYVRMYV